MSENVILNNVSALLCTDTVFDLFSINQKIANSTYNHKRLPGVVIRKKSPKCTMIVFKTGKIMLIGADSTKDAELNAKKICKEI